MISILYTFQIIQAIKILIQGYRSYLKTLIFKKNAVHKRIQ